LTVLNTLPTVIDDIFPSGYRKRQNFQDIEHFQKFSNKEFYGQGEKNRDGRVTVNTHFFFWPKTSAVICDYSPLHFCHHS
jgi:hypothetical protein